LVELLPQRDGRGGQDMHEWRLEELFSEIQYSENGDFDERCRTVEKYLQMDSTHYQIKRAVKENLMSANCEPGNVHEYVRKLLAETELGVVLRNRIYELDEDAKKRPRLPSKELMPRFKPIREQLDVVDMARIQWDSRLKTELRSLLNKLSRPAVRLRGGKLNDDGFTVRFIFTSEDLLEVILAIKNPNFSGTFTKHVGWNLLQLQLQTPTVEELRSKYRELSPDIRQMGVDDTIYGSEWFGAERERTGASLANAGYIPHLKNFAKTGVPNSLRPALWGRILGCNPTPKDLHRYKLLRQNLASLDVASDSLFRFDVQETTDNDEFFVFSDPLNEAMLIFSRDNQVRSLCSLEPTTAVLEVKAPSPLDGSSSAETAETAETTAPDAKKIAIPPCGIIPFYQLSLIAAPICFIHADVEHIYYMWRAMYCRYFCRLHIISSQKDTIYYLAKTFEDLLSTAHPKVYYHAVSIGAHPLRTVFPWIFTAFAGVLPVFQVLQVWDRIIAYNTLELLPTLAAAIYLFRADRVLEAKSANEVHSIFKETVHIQAIPLLQHFLFSKGKT